MKTVIINHFRSLYALIQVDLSFLTCPLEILLLYIDYFNALLVYKNTLAFNDLFIFYQVSFNFKMYSFD